MNWQADHVGFVLLSYGIAALVLGGVVVATLLRARSLRRELAAMKLSDPGTKES
jgi:heme exporter protein CcmD